MNEPLVWLILLIVFAGIEGLTAGLVSIWFCLGSLAALFAAWLHAPILVQVVLFAVVSILTMAIIRPLSKKWLIPKKERTNADRILGMEGIVLIPIDNMAASGQVKVGGSVWTARSASEQTIPKDSLVRVERIEGVKVIVTPIEKGMNE